MWRICPASSPSVRLTVAKPWRTVR
jgi:hypothetical protein